MCKKKIKIIVVPLVIFILMVGCASMQGAKVSNRKYEVIDWQGSSFGAEIPDWAMNVNDVNVLKKDEAYKGMVVRMALAEGKDIDLIKRWVQNDIAAAVVREIVQAITVKSGNKLKGNKDSDKDVKKFLDDTAGIASKMKIAGLGKDREFWTLRRDRSGKESYSYVAIYVINRENLMSQIDRVLGKVSATKKEEREMLEDIRDVIEESFNEVSRIEIEEQQ